MNTFQEVAVGNMKLIQKPEPPFYAFCTHCRQQYLDPQKWVDLSASYDGGVEEVGGLMVTIDDVHLCEGCAQQVGKLVGMVYAEELEETIEKQKKELQSLKGKLAFAREQLKEDKK